MFPQLGMMEMIVVMGVAVLLFGKRLPEVGRSLGKGIIEFKKGLRGIEDEFDLSSTGSSPSTRRESRPGRDTTSGSDHRRVVRAQVRAADDRPRAPDGIRTPADAGLMPESLGLGRQGIGAVASRIVACAARLWSEYAISPGLALVSP